MPRARPMKALRSLGARMRSRRLHLGRSREIVAQGAEISVTQLVLYESGKVTASLHPAPDRSDARHNLVRAARRDDGRELRAG